MTARADTAGRSDADSRALTRANGLVKSKIGQELRLVYAEDAAGRLELDDDLVLDDQIDAVTTVKHDALVRRGDVNL
jgi:hypothetical protein